MSADIGPRIGVDGEAEFRKQLTNINQQLKTLGTEMKAVTSAFDANDSSQEALAAQAGILTRQIEAQEQKLAQLQKGLDASAQKYGENDTRTLKWAATVHNATADLNKMRAQLSKVESEMDGAADASDDLADGMESAGDAAESSGGKFSAATVAIGNLAANAISAAVSAIGDMIGSLINLDQTTEEYRIAQGRLNTAYEAAGLGAETAQQAYRGFYGILGDTDTATEASQLLAQLATNEQEVATWTDIAAGVSGTFGDSLPIESLIEASNETAKVGEVTGTLADALNWVGISEDAFNEKLAACSSESERNQLIMETLSGQYSTATEAFYANNGALVQARENQAAMDEAMAGLGTTIGNVKNQIMSEFTPSIVQLTQAFDGLLTGAPGASAAMQQAISGMISTVVEQLPGVIDAGGKIILSIISGIVENIPQMVEAAVQIIGDLVMTLQENLPQMWDMGMGMLEQLVDGILSGIPAMIEQLPQVVDGFLNFISEQLPTILGRGVEIIKKLTAGIIQAIPDLVAQLPQIITSVTTFIAGNLPQIIQAGIEITINLLAGILQAIPEIVANLPQIINAIATGLVNIAGSLLSTGAQLLGKVWEGIRSGIGGLTANMGQVIDGIKTGLKNGISKITDIGRNIIEGLWNGINDMASWIGEKIKGFGEGVLNGIKNFFGIASPSKVMRKEVGVMLPRGMAQGMDDGIKYVEQAAQNLGTAIEDEIAKVNAEIAHMEADWNEKQAEEARQAEKEKAKARLQELEDFQREYEDGLAEIEKSQESMATKLSEYGDLFSSAPEGLELGDLQGQIDQIEAYGAALEGLKARGISESLMDEVLNMNVDDAIAYTTELLEMTDDEYSGYMGLWEQKQQEAQEIAEKFYKDEMDALEQEFVGKIPEAISGLKDGFYDVGTRSAKGLAEGLKSMQSYVSQTAVSIIENALAEARSAMGVHSPSTVWAGFGENLAAGVGVGFQDEMRNVSYNMQQALPIPETTLSNIAASMVNGIQTAMSGAGGTYRVEIPIEINGRELSRAVLPDLRREAKSNPEVLSGV